MEDLKNVTLVQQIILPIIIDKYLFEEKFSVK